MTTKAMVGDESFGHGSKSWDGRITDDTTSTTNSNSDAGGIPHTCTDGDIVDYHKRCCALSAVTWR